MYEQLQSHKQYDEVNSPSKQYKAVQYMPLNSENKNYISVTPSQFNSNEKGHSKLSNKSKVSEPSLSFGSPKSILYVEGKMFFKMAKEKLSMERYNSFLKCIRSLNQGQIGKQDAIEQCKNIFGNDNISLFNQFRQLLMRNELK